MRTFRAIQLVTPKGPISYPAGLEIQKQLIDKCKNQEHDFCILLQHSPVYTAGRRCAGFAAQNNHCIKDIPVYDVARGGQITYHGPGQLVLYPILNLRRFQKLDLHWYVRCLESVLLNTCKAMDIANVASRDSIGVWVENSHKIGFIGFHNTGWITSHGISLNVTNDLTPFKAIIPCGEPEMSITSIFKQQNKSKMLENAILEQSSMAMLEAFQEIFRCELHNVTI